MDVPDAAIAVRPIGRVRSTRKEPVDDYWGDVEAILDPDSAQFGPEALLGIDGYSHCEVVFWMDRLDSSKIECGSRHPRDRKDWPEVGVFAQRTRARPNRIGVSRCSVLDVEGMRVRVEGLDAIDGTPILDIKPYWKQMGPRGVVSQPAWVDELMTNYFAPQAERP